MLNGIGNQVRFGVTSAELTQKLVVAPASPAATYSSEKSIESDAPKKSSHKALYIAIGLIALKVGLVVAAKKGYLGETAQKYVNLGIEKSSKFYAETVKPNATKAWEATKNACTTAKDKVVNLF